MASGTEDPILIPSDDEDNDDVVLIKEEVEVDTDDVIFVSETKAPAPPVREDSQDDTSDKAASDAMDTGELKPLNLSSAGRLSSHNSADDLSTFCNSILSPLDLSSSKTDSNNQNLNSDKSTNSSMQDDLDLLNSLAMDMDVFLNSASDTGTAINASLSDNKTQGPNTSSVIQCDKVSGSGSASGNDVSSTSNQDTIQTPVPADTGSQSTYGISKTFNIDALLGDTVLSGASTSQSNTALSGASTSQSATVAMSTDSGGSSSVPKNDSNKSLSLDIKSNNSNTVSDFDSSQKLSNTADPMWSSRENVVNKIKQALPCYQMDTISPISQASAGYLGQQNSNDMSTSSLNNSSSMLMKFLLDDPFKPKQIDNKNGVQCSSNSLQLPVPQSNNSQTGLQTSTQTSLQSSVVSQSNTGNGSLSDSGLPGGCKFYASQTIGLSNQSAFRSINSINDSQTASHTQIKRSVSYTDQTYMYNPLTLPKSQKESYMRSFSSSTSLNSLPPSDYNKRKSDTLLSLGASTSSLDTSNSATEGPYQLPPKKQKRCFVELKCASCQFDIAGDKCCRCPNGHATCAKCLEERVKKILTGKAKESIRCLTEACDSFYAISELKLCLPSMVVEILEDRLDQDYIDYFSNMILKTAIDETTGEGAAGMESAEPEGLGSSRQGVAPKKPADLDPELPQHWEPMNEKSPYEMYTLDINSDEYNMIMPQFFASMINSKVEVVKIWRIQNPILWKFYSVKKKEMVLDNEGFGPVNEQQLFHGTDNSVVDAICKKGFDWRVCGKNGTMYGQGTYFAVNASYSHQYTDIRASSRPLIAPRTGLASSFFSNSIPFQRYSLLPNLPPGAINLSSSSQVPNPPPPSQIMVMSLPSNSGPSHFKILPKPVTVRSMSGHPTWPLEEFLEPKKHTTQMFVAKVLVGKYSGGSSNLRKPPPLDPQSDPFGKCYDSCVDNIHMPKLFVIFDSAQAYPEYLIEYTYE